MSALRSQTLSQQKSGAEMRKSMKIVVLAGGTSTERDVSLSSGAMIYRALKNRGHKAILLDVYLGYECKETQGEDAERIFDSERDWAGELSLIHI